MTSVTPHSPSTILLQAVSLWEQPGGLPPALERPILAPARLEEIPLTSPQLGSGCDSPIQDLVSRTPQHSTIKDRSILFPDTF